jgi:hypothetical protein
VGPRLYGVIGDALVLGELRHPTMHPMQPLRHGLGLCHVRTQVAMDEPLALLPDELPRLTVSVLGYLEEVSERTPVIYVARADAEAAAGWRGGRLVLGPLLPDSELPRRGLLRRRYAGPVDAALGWLGVPGRDRLAEAALREREEWEPPT